MARGSNTGMDPTSRPSVGTPGKESELTANAASNAARLLRPGTGRSRYLLHEVEFGIGRPDILLLVASPAALRRRRNLGLRIQNLTEARVLGGRVGGGTFKGITSQHAAAVERRLQGRGWSTSEATRALVADSLLIEAKVADWKRGIHQLARTRPFVHRAALLMPSAAQHLPNRQMLSRAGIGLLTMDERSTLGWRRKGRRRPLAPSAQLWLDELALRAMESG